MHWEVQITGDTSDLRMLVESLETGDVQLGESEHGYVLRALEFESLDSAGAVRDLAIEIVTALSGSARLALGAHQSLNVGAVYRVHSDGKRDITLFAEPMVADLRFMPVTLVLTRADGTTEARKPADPISQWLPLAMRNPAVARALRLRNADELGWTDLYRLYEVIEGDVGSQMYQLSWVTRDEVERFKRTANSVAAAGDQARHGKERTAPPPKPMRLARARNLIDGLLRSWLAWKAAQDEPSTA